MRGQPCQIIAADEVDDNSLVCAVGGMGAPTVGIERLRRGDKLPTVVRALEKHVGQAVGALVIKRDWKG